MNSTFKTVGLFATGATLFHDSSREVRSSKKIFLVLMIAAAILLPTVAILHATSATTHNDAADQQGHDSDHNDQNHHDADHDDNESSDDNSIVHADDDANENAIDTD